MKTKLKSGAKKLSQLATFVHRSINTRLGFIILLTFLFWLKSIIAYLFSFNLGLSNSLQYFILLINPLATTLFLLGLSLFIKRAGLSYLVAGITYLILSSLLLANVIYYREFSDFLTINTILGVKSVSAGLGDAAIHLFRPTDLIFIIDLIVFPILFWRKKINLQTKKPKFRLSVAVTSISIMLFSCNLSLANTDRSGLLTRTFSHDYIVKYLGISFFTCYDGFQNYQAHLVRATASPNDLATVRHYVEEHYAEPDPKMFGIAHGRNVIYLHLESFQQILIDYKLKDSNGVEHEVCPFLNSLYHSQSTASFDNLFHQVNSGRTSDAECLLENSLFGSAQGSMFAQLGDKNTFQAAPAILNQKAGYSSAVFHGNKGSFWNRLRTYKRLGYENFFDASYYKVNEDNSFQYGLHDKPMLQQSIPWLEHLQQPFYAKWISVSNHYPYTTLPPEEEGFPLADTDDDTINGYFATANYLDKAIEEFVNYLKQSKLYEHCVIVLYGDHYGISEERDDELVKLLGREEGLSSYYPKAQIPETSNSTYYHRAQLKRVPVMIHLPGFTGGQVFHTFGGQVDILPTLMHLLGIDTKPFMFLGQDLFSQKRNQIVAFRRDGCISPKFTCYHDLIFDTETGEELEDLDPQTKEEVDELKRQADTQLEFSDKIIKGDLLRFYTNGFTPVDPEQYRYKDSLTRLKKIEQKKGSKSTSIFSQNGNKTTAKLYQSKSFREYFPTSEPTNSTTETTNYEN